jgi:hypothetical protein
MDVVTIGHLRRGADGSTSVSQPVDACQNTVFVRAMRIMGRASMACERY